MWAQCDARQRSIRMQGSKVPASLESLVMKTALLNMSFWEKTTYLCTRQNSPCARTNAVEMLLGRGVGAGASSEAMRDLPVVKDLALSGHTLIGCAHLRLSSPALPYSGSRSSMSRQSRPVARV